jgi:ubiquinone/menaquinone biosynthesis C-methylase UbiE
MSTGETASTSTGKRERPDYGIDAPPVIRNLLLFGGAGAAVALVILLLGVPPWWGTSLLIAGILLALNCWLNAAVMLYYSKIAKVRARERFLDLVPWHGDEAVLDVGCGRGLLLLAAARRLTTGKAVGVDLWQNVDLSGNRPEATLENARREGVAERVEVKDGDARQLPFADAAFDVVVSGLALHNIPDAAGREKAIREIARVLKPGGHVALVDIQYTGDYLRVLRDCGLDAKRTPSGVLTWLAPLWTWGAVRPCRVTATKPVTAG